MNDQTEPQPGDDTTGGKYFISLCIHGADELRQKLRMDESMYRLIAPEAYSRARDYYLYGVLDEIERAGAGLWRFADFLRDDADKTEPSEERERRIHRNLLAATQAEQSLWIRRLTEILVELINFSGTNTQEYFRHYVLCKALGDYMKLQRDFSDYYACKNRNVDESIVRLKGDILKIETKISRQRCWYLQGQPSRRPSDFKIRLNGALLLASTAERVILGMSYEMVFAHVSRGVHLNIGSPDNEVSWDSVQLAKSQIEILAMQVLLRCRRLLRMRSRTGMMAEIAKVSARNRYPTTVYGTLARGQISRGDFVVAYGDLGEVLSSAKSKFGYKSFQIRYLSTPPIASIKTEWFPARYVRRIKKGTDLRRQMRKKLSAQGVAFSPRVIAHSLRKTMLDLWEETGLKEWARGNAAAAQHKRLAFLKKQEHQKGTNDSEQN